MHGLGVFVYLLDVLSSLGRGLHENKTVLPCKLLAFLCGDCPSAGKITLIPDEHNGHICVSMLPCIL